jgi:biopolymer transport protein ExbD
MARNEGADSMLGRKQEPEDPGIDLGIIITPMLDMAFQLLAFFIMTYNPPAREAVVDGSLLPPTNIAAIAKAAANDKTVVPDPIKGPGLTVLIKAVPPGKNKNETLWPGQPKAIYLKKPQDEKPRLVATITQPGAQASDPPDDWAAALKALADELALSRASPLEKSLPINLVGDRALRYGYFIAVQDAAKKAGFTTIGFAAPP